MDKLQMSRDTCPMGGAKVLTISYYNLDKGRVQNKEKQDEVFCAPTV